MGSVLLAWNPKRFQWGDLHDELRKVRRRGRAANSWSIGNRRELAPGTRFFLIRLGSEPRGLVGSGWTTSQPYPDDHWDLDRAARGEESRYIGIYFDVLQNTPVISMEELKQPPFSTMHWSTQMSGVKILDEITHHLEALWTRRTGHPSHSSVEELPIGAAKKHSKKVCVNRYERDPKARALCLAKHGTRCSVCKALLSEIYGNAAQDIVHVHHLTRLADIPDDYLIDPVRDLTPVCPNCHAVIHSRDPIYSLQEMRRMMASRIRKRRRQ